ncbi:MAG: DoxX family protein [Bacteroidota bacterium]
MLAIPRKILATKKDKILGVTRILLGAQFLTTAIMKYFEPFSANWDAQLTQANIPFYTLSLWLGPIVEMVVGLLLVSGFLSRIGGLIGVAFMIVATYAHLVVDPEFLPFGNVTSFHVLVPLMVLAGSAYVLWRGGGAWSADLRSSSKNEK